MKHRYCSTPILYCDIFALTQDHFDAAVERVCEDELQCLANAFATNFARLKALDLDGRSVVRLSLPIPFAVRRTVIANDCADADQ
ncbi:MAG: hypothetical protein ACI8W7_001141 [Gammaproteobacteria bacterium]|jgi:hypothetical protein